MQNEKNKETDRERRDLAKKLSLTCRSDDVDKKDLENEDNKDDIEADLISDEFFQQYLKQKLDEMQKNALNL